jgi:hypothetical protein
MATATRRASNPDHGQVGVGIASDKGGFGLAAVRKRHANRSPALDNVVVGQDQAVRGENDTRPVAARHFDAGHRRPNGVDSSDDRLRIGIKQGGIVVLEGFRDHESIVTPPQHGAHHPKRWEAH